MADKIIDNVKHLMDLNEYELELILSDEKYNKQNLRELVKRTLKIASEYKNAFEYEKSDKKKDVDERLRRYNFEEERI